MSSFGSLLVQNQIVGVNGIEQALQHQVIYGGDLATNLLELGLADEHVLSEFMARSLNMPASDAELIETISIHDVKNIPWSVVEAVDFVPIRYVGDRLQIAVTLPLDDAAAKDLAFLLGCNFTPCFALGFRLAMARNRLYGIPIPARLRALQERLVPDFDAELPPLIDRPHVEDGSEGSAKKDGSKYVVESAKEQKDLDSTVRIFIPESKSQKATDVKFLDVPEGYGQTEEGDDRRDTPTVDTSKTSDAPEEPPGDVSGQSDGSTKMEFQDEPQSVAAGSEPAFDVDEALTALKAAEDRDDVIDVVMEHSGRAFGFAVFLVVHGKVAQGRSAVHNRVRSDKVEFLSIPLDKGGMFQTVFESRSCHLGPLGTSETEQDILDGLGRPWPKNCAILPITLRNRVVSILYGDSGADGVDAGHIADFTRITQAVADSFERILLARKEKRDKKPASKTPEPPPEQTAEPPAAPIAESAGRYHLTAEVTESGVDSVSEATPDETAEAASSRPTSQPAAPASQSESDSNESMASAEEKIEEVQMPEVQFTSLDEGTTQAVLDHLDAQPIERPSRTSAQPSDVVITSPVVTVGQNKRKRSVIVEMKEEISRLVERILAPGRYDETAANLLIDIGDDALPKLISKFPGPLLCDRYQQVGRLQPVGSHGPVLQTVLKFKNKAVPHLTGLFESPDTDVRFYAVFMFSELIYPEAVSSLKSRLFDMDRQIRVLARDVLGGFQNYPEYGIAMKEVVELLGSPKTGLDVKLIAAEALGSLRVPAAVEALIQMLDSVDEDLGERCHRALVRITFEDCGLSVPRWLVWHERNRMRNRAEWAIDSVVHPKEGIRNAAISEIPTLVGDVVDWSNGPMDHKKRVELQNTLRDWWIREGRALFPNQGSD